jgi:hypothetical protein
VTGGREVVVGVGERIIVFVFVVFVDVVFEGLLVGVRVLLFIIVVVLLDFAA